jgi:hypothetical protein
MIEQSASKRNSRYFWGAFWTTIALLLAFYVAPRYFTWVV